MLFSFDVYFRESEGTRMSPSYIRTRAYAAANPRRTPRAAVMIYDMPVIGTIIAANLRIIFENSGFFLKISKQILIFGQIIEKKLRNWEKER